jgi:hypothetical protein
VVCSGIATRSHHVALDWRASASRSARKAWHVRMELMLMMWLVVRRLLRLLLLLLLSLQLVLMSSRV